MNEKHYLDTRNRTVKKSNTIIQKSRFNLSLQEQKIILYLISQIEPWDEDFKLYEFTIPEFCRVCGIYDESGKNYADLKNAVQELRNKSMWVDVGEGKEILLAWIGKAIIYKNSGTIQIRLDEDMKPYLLQLKKNYTCYELIWTLRFKSKYSIRLYELIKSIHYREMEEFGRSYTVEELKKLLDAESYSLYKNFKARVLLPAIKEINEYSDKKLTIEEQKKGNRVVAVEFTIRTKPASERMKVRDTINQELGPVQLTLWDRDEQGQREG